MFKIYKFTTDDSIMALPVSWVENGKVKLGPSARTHIKTKKKPLKSWPLFEVLSIDDRVYDSYDAALKAETLLLEQSEVGSSDFEKCNTIEAQSPKRCIKKKINANNLSSSESEDEFAELPAVPIRRTISCHDQEAMLEGFAYFYNDNCGGPPIEIDTGINVVSISSSIQQNVPTTANQEIAEEVIAVPETVGTPVLISEPASSNNTAMLLYSTDADLVRSIFREEFEKFKTEVREIVREELRHLQSVQLPKQVCSDFEEQNNLPLKTVHELKIFEDKIKKEESLRLNFKSYITKVGGRSAKEAMKVLNRIYDLSVQKEISYTGREQNKFPIKDLTHIKIIIEILGGIYSLTETETVLLLQKYLHQTCDRVRSAAKKSKISNSDNIE